MKAPLIVLFILLMSGALTGQTPRVPDHMEFAGMSLRIMEPARREIQENVDALTANPRYYDIYVQRARTYFPIIERVFREEGVPEDFKYLAIQESALISDAVSSADAVGFWQLKDFTAMEMGLRIDRSIDERMNIVSSSRAAARYLKKNNERYFDNWLITLMAYQMGPGAALKAGGEKFKGDHKMTIDRGTYWYIKKYLAHKVAFENALNGDTEVMVVEYTQGSGKSLGDIADEAGITPDQLTTYNKWLKHGKVPDDRPYTVVIPVTAASTLSLPVETAPVRTASVQRVSEKRLSRDYDIAAPDAFPEFDDRRAAENGKITEINGIKAVKARSNDRVASLASRGGITIQRFLRYNDLEARDHIIPGNVYYLKHKRSKAHAYYHAVQKGEDLWQISQRYGMKLTKLKKRNRITGRGPVTLKEGRILWLRYIRPADVPVEYILPEKVKEPEEPRYTRTEDANDPAQPSSGSLQFADDSENTVLIDAGPKAEEEPDPSSQSPAQETVSDRPGKEVRTEYEAVDSVRIIHRVKPGETYYAISRKYHVDIHQMLRWNHLSIADPLAIDQQLLIYQRAPATGNPPDRAGQTMNDYYTVQAGDTLYGIARKFDLTLQELKDLNGKTDNHLSTGEKLRVK